MGPNDGIVAQRSFCAACVHETVSSFALRWKYASVMTCVFEISWLHMQVNCRRHRHMEFWKWAAATDAY
eukprot:4253599-Amphidinium_carterae.1